MNICLIGDMLQLDPVRFRLYKHSLHLYQLKNISSPSYIGAKLFITINKVELKEQMRAAEDKRHQEIIQKIRNLDNKFPIDDAIINSNKD